MPLSVAALSDAFVLITNGLDPVSAADAWATAFDTYFQDATVPVVAATVIGGVTAVPKASMAAAMVALVQVDFPTALQTGIIAYWAGCVVLTGSGLFTPVVPPLALIVPPVLLTTPTDGLKNAIITVGAANKLASLNRTDAALAFATVIHPFNLGGTATQVVPPPTPHPIT
jgi:hypothetical protein